MARTKCCLILLVILVVGSGLLLHLFLSVRALEDRVFESKVRLATFAAVTSAIVEETRLTREVLLSSGVVSTSSVGDDYIVDVGGKDNWGIKYLFDSDERLIGWHEYPKVKRPAIELSNDLPEGPIDAFHIWLNRRRWRREIIYQDD